MRRALLAGALFALVCAPGLAAAQTPAGDAVLRRALADELARTTTELSLPGEPHTHFAAYTAVDSELFVAMATHGAVTFESAMPTRSLDVLVARRHAGSR